MRGLAETYADSHFISHVPFLAPHRQRPGCRDDMRRFGLDAMDISRVPARRRVIASAQHQGRIGQYHFPLTLAVKTHPARASSGRCGERARSDDEAGVARALAVSQCVCVCAWVCVCVCARVGQQNRGSY